jgi:hypothetical protein
MCENILPQDKMCENILKLKHEIKRQMDVVRNLKATRSSEDSVSTANVAFRVLCDVIHIGPYAVAHPFPFDLFL